MSNKIIFRIFALIGVLAIIQLQVAAQNSPIFPNLQGESLLEALRNSYKTNVVLSYADARDELFTYTANADLDTLRCVYSGYAIYLPSDQDPSTYAYEHGIDTEHTYPQSKGADQQPAKSDMHHLFPVRSNVNSSRGNDPFAEINDQQTDKWYRNSYSTGIMPTSYINEYSEHDNETQSFEPREDHKGNAARAVFYFYTMYINEANTADTAFFQIQKNTLYQWHLQDPSDQAELSRNDFIAAIQEGKPNPFILDPTLVQRAYFPSSDTTHTNPINNDTTQVIQYIAPNPAYNNNIKINYVLPDEAQLRIEIFDIQGKMITQLVDETQSKGEHTAYWDATAHNGTSVAKGLYIARLSALINDRIIQEKKMLVTIR